MTRILRLAVVPVIASFAVFLIVVVTYAAAQKRAADIIDDLRILASADDPGPRFDSVKKKYGSELRPSDHCTSEGCFYEISVNNQLLAKLHLADYAEMTTGFVFSHGFLSLTITHYRVALPGGVSPVVDVQEDYCQGKCSEQFGLGAIGLGVNPHGRRSTNLWNGMVEFNANASSQERAAARSFNFRCFSPFARCRDIVDLLPNVWQRNPDRSIRCRFRTSGDALNDWD
jgi:hypothetical protein